MHPKDQAFLSMNHLFLETADSRIESNIINDELQNFLATLAGNIGAVDAEIRTDIEDEIIVGEYFVIDDGPITEAYIKDAITKTVTDILGEPNQTIINFYTEIIIEAQKAE